jgi:adenine-specific DNA-methyltransferase
MPELFSCPPPDYEKMFREKDERGKFYFDRLDKKGIDSNRPNLIYPIECPDGSIKDISPAIWRLSEAEFLRRKANDEIGFKKDKHGKWQVYTKTYLVNEDGKKRRVKARSVLKQELVGFTQNGNKEIMNIFGAKVFQNPKPIALLKYLIDFVCDKDDVVLDFFAGSATITHATMQLNAGDQANRKIIMVQLPETTDENSEAYKAGYKTIAEISKERIRRAAAKIKAENPDYEGDLGFKVFKLDSTNINPWEADSGITEKYLEGLIFKIKRDRSEDDILYEVLLKTGLDLTLPITEHIIDGQKVFDIGFGALIVCLSDKISDKISEGIIKLKEELNPKVMRVRFNDSGFNDDNVKINTILNLKQAGIADLGSI